MSRNEFKVVSNVVTAFKAIYAENIAFICDLMLHTWCWNVPEKNGTKEEVANI